MGNRDCINLCLSLLSHRGYLFVLLKTRNSGGALSLFSELHCMLSKDVLAILNTSRKKSALHSLVAFGLFSHSTLCFHTAGIQATEFLMLR